MSFRNRVPGLDSGSDVDDSDDDDVTSWKRARSSDIKSSLSLSRVQNHTTSSDVANVESDVIHAPESNTVPTAVLQNKTNNRKKNNIWGNVLNEDALSSSLVGSGIKTFDRSRDVESYDYTKVKELEKERKPPKKADSWIQMDKPNVKYRIGKTIDDDMLEDNETIDECVVDKGDDTISPSRDSSIFDPCVKSRLGKKDDEERGSRYRPLGTLDPDVDLDSVGVDSRKQVPSQKRHHDAAQTESEVYSDVKMRLGKRLESTELSAIRMGTTNYVELSVNDSLEKVVNGLSLNLNEPKIALIKRVVEKVGIAKALQLQREVEMIEDTGGLMTMAGTRRRTPGGVFLFLLKHDPDVSAEQRSYAFKEDRQIAKASRKKWHQKQKQAKVKEKSFEDVLAEYNQLKNAANVDGSVAAMEEDIDGRGDGELMHAANAEDHIGTMEEDVDDITAGGDASEKCELDGGSHSPASKFSETEHSCVLDSTDAEKVGKVVPKTHTGDLEIEEGELSDSSEDGD